MLWIILCVADVFFPQWCKDFLVYCRCDVFMACSRNTKEFVMDLEIPFVFFLQLGALHLCEGGCGINDVGDVIGAGVG